MANTYTCLHYHINFGTKNRQRWISPVIEERLWAYLCGIAVKNGMTPIKIGGVEDHVHVQLLKGGSSAWIHETFPKLAQFAWQDGYSAFTVSKSQLPDLIESVKNQREHHRTRTFQEEYRAFLDRHGVEYDERYLWG